MNYLLDTDVIIDYLNKKGEAYQLIEELLNREAVFISVVTLTEVRAGWDKETTRKFLPAVSALFPTISVDDEIALHAGEQLKTYAQQGKTLSVADTLIGATAYLHECCLVTRNVKDFPMPYLHLLNPQTKQ